MLLVPIYIYVVVTYGVIKAQCRDQAIRASAAGGAATSKPAALVISTASSPRQTEFRTLRIVYKFIPENTDQKSTSGG